MTQFNVWVSNYNKPSDQLRSYTEKLIKKEFPNLTGKTIRVYVHSRGSAHDDITDQLETLRVENRLHPGDQVRLRGIFGGGDWAVKGARVVRESPSD